MKHRDRVLAALDRQPTDRCPMQISFTPEFARLLRKHLALEGKVDHNPHGGGNTYELERAIDEDLLLTSVGWANCYYQQEDAYTDEWGIRWKSCTYQTKFGSGYYTEIDGQMNGRCYTCAVEKPAEAHEGYFVRGSTDRIDLPSEDFDERCRFYGKGTDR